MPDAREPSLVLFDLGGVVCRFLPERRLRLLASASGKPAQEIDRLLWESGFSRRCDRGEYGAAEMHAEACERIGWNGSYADFRGLWASAFEPDPAVLSLVDRLRETRATGLLSDNSAVLQEALTHELSEVGAHFAPVLFSCGLGSCKPEPGLFRAALARAGRAPDQVLFIDDVQANIDAATRLGIAALRFTDPAALERDLASAGLLAPRAA